MQSLEKHYTSNDDSTPIFPICATVPARLCSLTWELQQVIDKVENLCKDRALKAFGLDEKAWGVACRNEGEGWGTRSLQVA